MKIISAPGKLNSMTKKFLMVFAALANIAAVTAQSVRNESYTVDGAFVEGGYYTQKIPLQHKGLPEITIVSREFRPLAAVLPDSLLRSPLAIPQVQLGFERKKPFAFVRIPAYQKKNDGITEQLREFTVTIKETGAAVGAGAADAAAGRTARVTAPSSVLANGTWNKIAVASRGIYKVDYDFLKNKAGAGNSLSSANIRLFGNGGTMLYENNAVARPDDLVENAIDMHDGGDGSFGPGDYFLFYANGPMEWVADTGSKQFRHRTNLYADSSYYFITLDNGTGLRMSAVAAAGAAATVVNTYNDYALHELELQNLGQFGKDWWGEGFGNSGSLTMSNTVSFTVPGIIDSVSYRYRLASAAIGKDNSSAFTAYLNNSRIGYYDDIYGVGGGDGDDPGRQVADAGTAAVTGAALNFRFDFQFITASSGKGYLDYVEINMRRRLEMAAGAQLSFRDWKSVGQASVRYELANAGSNLQVWDVSNPLRPGYIQGTVSGTVYSFSREALSLHEFIATDGNYLVPAYSGKVANQNLHGLNQVDYVIIAHEELMDAANKLADFHRNNSNLTVVTVPVHQVYNEFSSGAPDISAMRDFMRMFYDRGGDDDTKLPRHLLLLGQASYDYKNIVPASRNALLVPTYETDESLWSTIGYCSDDFFAILDSNENMSGSAAMMDIGVGRIPATSKAEANAVVDKLIRYKSNDALGPWRINNVYIGDNEDGAGNHLADADSMSRNVESSSTIYNAMKVYLDNMNIISTPAGSRCPDANKVINDNIYKGTFLFNYSGHGSIFTLSKMRVLTQDDFKSWKNTYKMPIMVTATCDFSRFDNPSAQSAGEKLILKPDGGAIALITTTQVVYASPNKVFNAAYLKVQFHKNENGWYSFGDAFRVSKNSVLSVTGVTNSRKFALLGDPAMIPDFPRYDVVTDSLEEWIDDVAVRADSVKSLGTYRIKGSVRDDDGMIMTGFNGKVNISFYDKPQLVSITTAMTGSGKRNYYVRNNVIYKGTATVKDGLFTFSFITPKDINYDFGKGKISYYADNGTIDAAGADTALVVGGFSDYAGIDNDAPVVRPYMNDSLFRDGGITGPNSILYAIITDKSGINVSGNFVGHDLSAVLDDVVEAPYIMNDYYETAPNTYQRGYVNFPVAGLADGKHTLRVKAWDVYNNSGEGVVNFVVLNGKVVQVQNISNYPNPFTDITHFVFDHNHPNEALKATIHIFNSSGSLVRTLEQEFTPSGSRSAEVIWDGTGNGGEKLQPGIYPYRIRIATETNIEDLGYQKVILVR